MKKNLILIFLMGLILTSCSVTKNSYSVSRIKTSIEQYPIVADIEVGEKIEKTETWIYNPFIINNPSLEIRTNNLISDMVKSSNADVLIEPETVYVKKAFGRRSITVSGYPAKFKNIRKATEKDLEILRCDSKAHAKNVYPINFNDKYKENKITKIVRKIKGFITY